MKQKKRSWSGLIGLLMLTAGAKLFFSTDSEYLPVWVAWLVGPILWYSGFIFVCYWFLKRIFGARLETAEEKEQIRKGSAVVATMVPKPDSTITRYEFVRPGVSYTKYVLIGMTLSLLIATVITLR